MKIRFILIKARGLLTVSFYVDKNGKPYKTAVKIDYVVDWYFKAGKLMQDTKTVMQAYGFSIKMTESECVAELMEMYQRLTKERK